MDKHVKAILYNPVKGRSTKVLLRYDGTGSLLKSIYSVMDVDMIEHVNIDVDLEAYVDEEGLLKETQVLSVVYTDGTGKILRSLVGNVLFINSDDEGNTVSLTEEQIKRIEALELAPLVYEDGRSNYAIVLREGDSLVA